MARDSRRLTISQLARAANVPASTLRYYERIGLVAPEDRSAAGYRLYSEESLRRMQFIRAAQAIGFALSDVSILLGMDGRKSSSCREVQALIAERLVDIRRRLNDLRHVERVLRAAMGRCKKHERAGCCHVLETLRSNS